MFVVAKTCLYHPLLRGIIQAHVRLAGYRKVVKISKPTVCLYHTVGSGRVDGVSSAIYPARC